MVIESFRHKGLERFIFDGDKRGLDAQQVPRIGRILDRLDASETATDMNLPGFDFHSLRGNRKDTYSVKVTGNLRITFRFKNGKAFDVNLEDYH